MKKTFLIATSIWVLNVQCSMFNSLYAQGFDWGRISINVNGSMQPFVMMQGSGLLGQHPDRSVSLGVSYRLWQHCEAGLYAYYMGAQVWSGGSFVQQPTSYSHHWIYVQDESAFGWGALVQLHLVPYRYRRDIGGDMVLRLGMDITGMEADALWAGLGYFYDLSRHVSLSAGSDFGSFRYSRMNSSLMGGSMWGTRVIVGVQVRL